MAQSIGSLFANLGLNSAEFDAGIDRSRAKLMTFGKVEVGKGLSAGLSELDAGFKSTANQAGILGAGLSAMGLVGVGAAASLVALGGAASRARAAFDFADEIADAADGIGVSTDALQEYRYAITMLGGDAAKADAALSGFSKSFALAQSGYSKKALKPFDMLGIDVDAYSSAEDAILDVVQAINSLGSVDAQNAIADKLGLGTILPAIREGAGSIRQFRDEARSTGVVMDASLIRKAGEANDELQKMQRRIDVELNSAFANLAPNILTIAENFATVTSTVKDLTKWLGELQKWEAKMSEKGIMDSWGWVGNAGKAVGDATGLSGFGPWVRERFGSGADKPAPAAAPAPTIVEEPRPPATLIDPNAADEAAKAAKAAAARASASATAVEMATRAELQARQSLTQNIMRLTALKVHQVDIETEATNRRLREDAAEGTITQAAAAKAIALNNQAAASERELLLRELSAGLAREELDQREAISRQQDRVSAATAELATTAEARGAAELEALDRRQADEMARLQADMAEKVRSEAKSQADADALIAATAQAQQAERGAAIQANRVRVEQEARATAEAAAQLEQDMLGLRSQLAETITARRAAELAMLASQKKAERDRLSAITTANGFALHEEQAAQDRLAQLDDLYDAQAELIDRVYSLRDAFYEASDRIGDMADAFENNDYVGLQRAFSLSVKTLEDAFGPGGTLDSKVAAVAGVLEGLGRAIGGTSGATLSGAASGAMAGFSMSGGNPIVAAIGGVLGGLGGLFGSNKAKKQAKAQAAEQLRDQQVQQEIALLQAQGKSLEALNRQREHELSKMSASLRARQQEIWALEDSLRIQEEGVSLTRQIQELDDQLLGTQTALADRRREELAAADPLNRHLVEILHSRQDELELLKKQQAEEERAAEITASARELEIRIMEASGDEAGALAARRAIERAEVIKLDASLAPLIDRLYATEDAARAAADAAAREAASREVAQELAAERDRAIANAQSALSAAYNKRRGELETLRDRFEGLGQSLRTLARDLSLGELSGATAQERYQQLGAEVRDLAARMKLNDASAMEAWSSVSKEFLAASQDVAEDELAYLRDLAWIRSATDEGAASADRQVSAAERQLELLDAQVAGLLQIDQSVLSVEAAIGALHAAMFAPKSVPGVGGVGGGVDNSSRPETSDGQFLPWDLNDYDWHQNAREQMAQQWAVNREMGFEAWKAARGGYGTERDYWAASGLQLHDGSLYADERIARGLEPTAAAAALADVGSSFDAGRSAATDYGALEAGRLADAMSALAGEMADVARNTSQTNDTLTMATRKGQGFVMLDEDAA